MNSFAKTGNYQQKMLLYSKVAFNHKDQFENFIAAIISNKQHELEKAVKRIRLDLNPTIKCGNGNLFA